MYLAYAPPRFHRLSRRMPISQELAKRPSPCLRQTHLQLCDGLLYNTCLIILSLILAVPFPDR